MRTTQVVKGSIRDKILPLDVLALDQIDLPVPFVFLQPRFAIDREVDITELLELDEPCHTILLREFRRDTLPVLKDAAHQVIGYTDVQCPIAAPGEDVDEIDFEHGCARS